MQPRPWLKRRSVEASGLALTVAAALASPWAPAAAARAMA